MTVDLTILHFCDAYQLFPGKSEPVAGAARFAAVVKSQSDTKPLLLSSGDLFSPSFLSTVYRGKHMLKVLNTLKPIAICYGNHDFDYGQSHLQSLISQSNSEWLLSNVNDKKTGKPLMGKDRLLIDWEGVKVGIIGLIEREWIETLSMDTSHFDYKDFIETGDKIAKELRNEGAQIIVALTHMRVPNDQSLGKATKEIDLILGGHDHHYYTEEFGDVLLVKSGCDFKYLSKISVTLNSGSKPKFSLETIECTSEKPEDEEMKTIVRQFEEKLGVKLGTQIGFCASDLEGRFSHVRSRESNYGNFVCDVMRRTYKADLALLNGGSIRSDTITKAGQYLLSDLLDSFPTDNELTVIRLSGEKIVQAIENGVSGLPALEGRFLQISGGKYTFDLSRPKGKRVSHVEVNDNPIDINQMYTLVTNHYIATGADGFTMLAGNEVVVDHEQGQVLRTLLRDYFKKLNAAQAWQQLGKLGIVYRALYKMRGIDPNDRFFNAKCDGRITCIGDEENKDDEDHQQSHNKQKDENKQKEA
eukprot:TRINITY_DN10556_c0_g1_i1.p1 TRINITY_DN10556_c0_g1~~TRINITY_DN10556_c0_g1_i1.p1  ORF type:complete len:529 (+),score=99.65 TRINITY_DN10556_c0_g1_i1:24-1610(+)